MSALAVSELESLLRRRGLGSAVKTPETTRYPPASTGFMELDGLLGGGAPRGEIINCLGGLSAGCTTVGLSIAARATQRGERTAYVDASDGFDPAGAARVGVELDRLLWVRCNARKANARYQAPGKRFGRPTQAAQAWKATKILASSAAFEWIVLDLIGLAASELRELQRSPWVGLRQAIAQGRTSVLVLASEQVTGSAAACTLRCERRLADWRGSRGPSLLLAGTSFEASLESRRRGVGRAVASNCLLEARR